MNYTATEIRLVEYVAFIAPDITLSNFEFKQEYYLPGSQLPLENKKFILDIVFDDSTGGMKRPRISKPESYNTQADLRGRETNSSKEYKVIHFTTTDENGLNKFITLMLFHIDDQPKRTSRLDSETLNDNNMSGFESASKTPFSSKMRTFFETQHENSIPVAVC